MSREKMTDQERVDAALLDFPAWVRQQDPARGYHFADATSCALATFLSERLEARVIAGPHDVNVYDGEGRYGPRVVLPSEISDAVADRTKENKQRVYTYGALAERLAAVGL